MIRGALSALFTKVTPGFRFKSLSVMNGSSSFIFKSLISQQNVNFTSLVPSASCKIFTSPWDFRCKKKMFLEPQRVSPEHIRTLIKYSWAKGKRKSVKVVPKRFFRLHWGIWIRPMAGRHKKLWKKSASRRNRLLNHVFCNATQSRMLDKMVSKYWRKPKYYIDDPYEPYHKRESYWITRKKPWRPEGVDYE